DLTVGIVGKTVLDDEAEVEAEQVRKALSESMQRFNRFMLPFAEFLDRLPLPGNRRYRQARDVLDSIIYRIINERRQSGQDTGDLLSMLLTAQDDEGDGRGMTDLQLRDEVITIFLAGHETTANTLTWTWHLLSEHRETDWSFNNGWDQGPEGRFRTVGVFPLLQYTKMVIREPLCFSPPAWIMGRRALKDYQLGPYVMPAGSIVIMS